ncbi:MAG: ATP-binding protein [Candidatus Omnitrophica bacterium]|nr:ATP-binding protein [Candidatus Omnitrophota bacterium]
MEFEPNFSFKDEIINGKPLTTIIIEDNGIGWQWDDMPKHVREKYLNAKKVIENIGGEFSYEAIPFKGAKVTIKLPLPYQTVKNLLSKAILRFQSKLNNK